MDYGKIISESWSLLWKNKILWVFGFLAALGGGGGGSGFNGNFSGSNFQFPSGGNGPSDATTNQFDKLFEAFGARDLALSLNETAALVGISTALFLAIIAALFVIGIVLWLVGLVARAGLISAVVADQNGKPITWSHLLTDGPRHLWRLVGLKIVLYIVPILLFFGTFAFMFGSIFLSFAGASGDFSQPPAFLGLMPIIICGFACIGIPLMIALQIVDGYAFRGIVMDELGIVDSIKRGWCVGLDNLGSTIVLGIIFVLIGIAFAVVLAIVLLVPFGLIFAFGAEPSIGFFTTIGITALVILLGAAVVNTFCVGLQSIAFSKLYLEFTGDRFEQKTV